MVEIGSKRKPLKGILISKDFVFGILTLTVASKTGNATITAAMNTSVISLGGLWGSDLKL